MTVPFRWQSLHCHTWLSESLVRHHTPLLPASLYFNGSSALKTVTKQRKNFPDKLTRGRQKMYRLPEFGSNRSSRDDQNSEQKIIGSYQLDQNSRKTNWISTTWSAFRVQNTTSTIRDPNPREIFHQLDLIQSQKKNWIKFSRSKNPLIFGFCRPLNFPSNNKFFNFAISCYSDQSQIYHRFHHFYHVLTLEVTHIFVILY